MAYTGGDNMYRQKLCLNLSESYSLGLFDQIKVIRDAGFEEIFICADGRNMPVAELVKTARDEGVFVQSLHAPFGRCDVMWDESGDKGDDALDELLYFTDLCARLEIPVMVSHAFIGFNTGRAPTQAGLERYGKIARRASELGIKVAFENTEGLEFLDALLTGLSGEKSVGFCWDSGHEQCYNYGKDLLALYGDKLVCTHLNDNLGISDYGGNTIFTDDLHLLPFDGIINWREKAAKLNACGFDGTLTFELKRRCFDGRYDNAKYEKLTPEEFIAEAYARACRFAAMKTTP